MIAFNHAGLYPPTDCITGTVIPDSVINAVRAMEAKKQARSEELSSCAREVEEAERAFRRAQEALFLAECKRGWLTPARIASAYLTRRRPTLIPVVFQRRFSRHDRNVAVA